MKQTYDLLSQWEDLKDAVVYQHKPKSKELQIALSSFGFNKELYEYEMDHRDNLLKIEDKWDHKFSCWIDLIECGYFSFTKQRINNTLINFTNKFKYDIIKMFPISEEEVKDEL